MYNQAIMHINRILRITETGLRDKWISLYVPSSPKCNLKLSQQREKGKSRLTISHLSGAFVVLAAGYFLSIVVFAIEKIIAFMFK